MPTRARTGVVVVTVLLGVAVFGVGLAGAVDGGPPPDLDADDPEAFWADLTPEERADILAEFPPEDGQTIPALTEEEMEADLARSAPDISVPPPESGIIDDCSINVGPFRCTNGWQEVTPLGGDNYMLLQVAAGFSEDDPGNPGMILVWANRPEPGTEDDLWAGHISYYRAPPTGGDQLRIISADGHTFGLAGYFANIGDPPILTFDLDTRTFRRVTH